MVDQLRVKKANVADLRTYHRNPRQGDTTLIRESLEINGQYKPLCVNTGSHTGRSQEVLAGNHTLIAARDAGWSTVQIVTVDVDDDQAARIVAVDNRSADKAGYDNQLLAELLGDLPDLDGTGYDPGDLEEIVRHLHDPEPVPGNTDPDDAPEVPTEAISVTGDVWILGEHRLVVGDATSTDVWDSLLDGSRADLVWTDPPYGVSYVGKTKDALQIEGDDRSEQGLADFLRAVFGVAFTYCTPGACWYVAAPAGPLHLQFAMVLAELDVWRQTLMWVKDQFVMGRSDYHYRHEPVFYGWTQGQGHHAPPDRKQDTVHEIARPRRSEEHPTMKPVELVEKHVCNSSEPAALVLDPFAGSGTTLIAAHRNHRRAALIELDPHYADVICRRFQQHTGTLPVRSGVEVNFTRDAETAPA